MYHIQLYVNTSGHFVARLRVGLCTIAKCVVQQKQSNMIIPQILSLVSDNLTTKLNMVCTRGYRGYTVRFGPAHAENGPVANA